MSVVILRRETDDSLIAVLEHAVERAKAGKIRGFCLVETGPDELGEEHKVRLSEVFNDIRDPTHFLGLIGGLEFQKHTIINDLCHGPEQ